MSRSIQRSVRRTAAAVLAVFLLICTVLALLFLYHYERMHSRTLAAAAAEAAVLLIDADAAKDYLTLRQTDEEYLEVSKKLNTYVKESGGAVRRLSLVSFSNTAGSYIYDTGGQGLASRLEYDDALDSVRAELINGRDTWFMEQKDVLVCFMPVRTVDDRLTGYLICTADSSRWTGIVIRVLLLALAAAAAGTALLVLFMQRLKKRVFRPIALLTDTALHFTGNGTGVVPDTEALAVRDDEIGRLSNAVQRMLTDISSGAENLSRAIYDANHDSMTQVYNKGAYAAMEEKFRSCGSVCLIYFDVNNLKLMNDTLGHERGDYVIQQAAEYIRGFLTPSDYCFRMGGDEFLMVMTGCSYRAIDALASKLDADAPYILSAPEDSVRCALSYGYAYAKGSYAYEALLTEAEENMYAKKTELKELMQMPER